MTQGFSFVITTVCNLKCKACIHGTPYAHKKYHMPKSKVINDCKNLFERYSQYLLPPDKVHADITGGEPLLHPDINSIVEEIFKFNKLYSSLRIVTNCTVVPTDELLSLICDLDYKHEKIWFYLSNYGKISKKTDDLKSALNKYKIPYLEYKYFGDSPEYGGWIDLGFNNENTQYVPQRG